MHRDQSDMLVLNAPTMVTGRKQALTTGTLEHKRLTLNYRCISCRSDLEDGLMAVSGYFRDSTCSVWRNTYGGKFCPTG